jgi:hypothetical protein
MVKKQTKVKITVTFVCSINQFSKFKKNMTTQAATKDQKDQYENIKLERLPTEGKRIRVEVPKNPVGWAIERKFDGFKKYGVIGTRDIYAYLIRKALALRAREPKKFEFLLASLPNVATNRHTAANTIMPEDISTGLDDITSALNKGKNRKESALKRDVFVDVLRVGLLLEP